MNGGASLLAAALLGGAVTTLCAHVQEAPAPVLSAEEVAARRAARIAVDLARAEAQIAAVDRFGQVDRYSTALRALLGTVKERFADVGDGVFTDIALKNWLDWNESRAGGPVLPELDRDATNHPYSTIVDLARQLRAHDVDFLLVTFPTRPALYPELAMELPTLDGFAGFCPATPRFNKALAEAGVEVLDLTPEFVAARYGEGGDRKDQLFLRYNQHWTPRGAELAARRIAERLAQYPWFTPGPAKEGVDWVATPNDVDVKIQWGGTPEGAQPERLHCTQVTKPKSPRLDAVRPSSPITLLSGSFADFHNSSQCDFTAQLYRFTGWSIDKINPKGGVEDACREALAQKTPADWKKKRIVVWMLPEQAFRVGPMWRPIALFDE